MESSESSWWLLLPPDARSGLALRQIRTRRVGCLRGHVWEQVELARAASEGVLVSLGNSGPMWHRKQIVAIHDAGVFANPENYSVLFRTWYRVLLPILGRRAHTILTVSRFSKSELLKYCAIPEGKVQVVYNGVGHIAEQIPAQARFLSPEIHERRYVLCVGSRSPNKNFKLVVDALNALDGAGVDLVVVGGVNRKVFADALPVGDSRIHDVGYVADEVLQSLYAKALCFIFPSLYEGFGIPPLEAMSCGCPVIVADIPALRESCGTAALYCDPHDALDLAAKIRLLRDDAALYSRLKEEGLARAKTFTWDACAQDVFAFISKLAHV